jgi:hypothetical protein
VNAASRKIAASWWLSAWVASSSISSASIALAMAVDRAENQPEPAKVIGWL